MFIFCMALWKLNNWGPNYHTNNKVINEEYIDIVFSITNCINL